MRRTLLSVGVQAGGASLRERKSPGDFPNPPVSLPKSGGEPEKDLPCGKSFFGVSAGARTRTGSVGGSNGIQFHHGHIFRYFGNNSAFR